MRVSTPCHGAWHFIIIATLAAAAWAQDEKPAVAPPAIIAPEQWESEPDPIPEHRRHTPTFITIHHAGVLWKPEDDPYHRIKALQTWGKRDKQWPDVPYHFLIAPDGTIFVGRDINYEPETNTDYDVRGHVGIQFWGSFQQQRASRQQLEAAVDLVAWLGQEHQIETETIRGHSDVASTACPGEDLYRYIRDGLLRQWVDARLAGEEPKIELLPALESGPVEIIPGGSE